MYHSTLNTLKQSSFLQRDRFSFTSVYNNGQFFALCSPYFKSHVLIFPNYQYGCSPYFKSYVLIFPNYQYGCVPRRTN
jgi:hypothetical protein